MELTDREIRNVGEGRYVRRRRRWMVFTGFVGIAWLLVYGQLLMPTPATTADAVRLLLFAGIPSVAAIFWPFMLAGKAGKRFLAQWTGEHRKPMYQSVDRVELTDWEIRGIGLNRYVRRWVWRLVIGGLVLLAWTVLVRWLWPADPTPVDRWMLVTALSVVPYGAIVWLYLRANKAGKRFLAQWKAEEGPTDG